jgi:hypothetical protein
MGLSIFLSENEDIYFCRLDETRDDDQLQSTNDDIGFPDFGFSWPTQDDVVVESPGSLASGAGNGKSRNGLIV